MCTTPKDDLDRCCSTSVTGARRVVNATTGSRGTQTQQDPAVYKHVIHFYAGPHDGDIFTIHGCFEEDPPDLFTITTVEHGSMVYKKGQRMSWEESIYEYRWLQHGSKTETA